MKKVHKQNRQYVLVYKFLFLCNLFFTNYNKHLYKLVTYLFKIHKQLQNIVQLHKIVRCYYRLLQKPLQNSNKPTPRGITFLARAPEGTSLYKSHCALVSQLVS